MTKRLDRIDNLIVVTLRENARTPIVALARTIGLSRSATQERLARLEKSGVIAGYTIRTAQPEACDVRVWMFLTFHPGVICKDIVPSLMRHPEIRLCHSLSGKPDLTLLAHFPDHESIMDLREAIAQIPGMADVHTAPVLKGHFDAWSNEVSDVVMAAQG
jgi:Lrp/AsnC family transcriptional regulator, leucine-responsive regulatory protein